MPNFFHLGWLNNLYPVPIEVLDEGNVFEFSLVWALDKRDLVQVESSRDRVYIWHRKTDVTKSLALCVFVVVFDVGIIFSAPVMGKF